MGALWLKRNQFTILMIDEWRDNPSDALKSWRIRNGLTRKKAAMLLGYTETMLWSWETNKQKPKPLIGYACEAIEARLNVGDALKGKNGDELMVAVTTVLSNMTLQITKAQSVVTAIQKEGK